MLSLPPSVCACPEELQPLFAYLDSMWHSASLKGLVRILRSLTLPPESVAEYVRFSDKPGEYTRNTIRMIPGKYQVMLLCWKPGDASPIHDHAGSACAVRVVQGTGAETVYQRLTGKIVRPAGCQILEPGMVLGSQDMDIHRVAAGPVPLVTLHVYTPELDMKRVCKDYVVLPGGESR